MNEPIAVFNPRPSIQALMLGHGRTCFVVDDALVNPDQVVRFALDHRDEFRPAPFNAYPGIEMPMPAEISARLDEFFMRHIRGRLHARRTRRMNCRLSMVTLAPEQLQARQWICHRDSQRVEPGQCIAASVLYLFKDSGLGGTSFYAPRKAQDETARLIHDSSTAGNDAFARKYAIAPGYFSGSNDYFERIGSVPAQWTRMIFYDGGIFHSGDILAPERLSADPLEGRLTLNGFFTCTRKAA
jgi:hypothetical protein